MSGRDFQGGFSLLLRTDWTARVPAPRPSGLAGWGCTKNRTWGKIVAPALKRAPYGEASPASSSLTASLAVCRVIYGATCSHVWALRGRVPVHRSVSAGRGTALSVVRLPNTTAEPRGKKCGRSRRRSHDRLNATAVDSEGSGYLPDRKPLK